MKILEQVQGKWTLDPVHSELTFKVRHLMISNVKGEFTDFDVEMNAGEDLTDTKILVDIDGSSISTNNKDRDDHLKSEDFFDVNNYPKLTFESSSIENKGGNAYNLNGTLSIKGVQKEVTLDLEFGGLMKDPYGNEKAGFSVNGKINRKDFGLNWNAALEAGGVMVGDEVHLSGEVQLVKQS
ncbi:YceI family protein [Gramella jeungdoensis]|uniref:YceI family protein n=1 Tax=Gramella jeungdoensis TaxID=708091 RepID=A0ABT0Z491_9FLAO|nr:YceI family protein [Gramella jeungdoensis]MCM8570339.1 YceI family protein [Gramella jeungdoensis]